MKGYVIILALTIFPVNLFSQIGINTSNPKGVFHVDGGRDNASSGLPTTAQQLNDLYVDNSGKLGVGIISVTNKVNINSGLANTSGLTFTNLTAASPASLATPIGVDANGTVVTVSSSEKFGQSFATGNITSPGQGSYFFPASITIPAAGTYVINISVRVQGTGLYRVYGFVSTTTEKNFALRVPDSEILIAYNFNAFGNTGTGSVIVKPDAPTTYYLGLFNEAVGATFANDVNGRSNISYFQIPAL